MLSRLGSLALFATLAITAACRGEATRTTADAAPGAVDASVASSVADAAPSQAVPRLVAIDLFGTRQLTREQLLAACEPELRAFAEAGMGEGRGASEIWTRLVNKVATLGDFAEIEPSLVGYYEPEGMKYYLTIDLVDKADATRRRPFLPAPKGTYADPEGLIADWEAYEAKVHGLMATGDMSNKRVECPAFHCFGDPRHPEVQALAERFVARVPLNVDVLATILRDDENEGRRAAAAFLLAYDHDGQALATRMVAAFRDPSSLVRNNAMRVVSDLAFYHPEIDVPIEPALAALDYPTTLDRNKAAAIINGLLSRPGGPARWGRVVATRAGETLLAMLRLEQPNNHNFAYLILKAISGLDLGEHNDKAWAAWLRTHR